MVTEVDPNSRHFSASSLMVGRAAHTEISAPMLMALMSSDNPHRWNSNTTTKDLWWGKNNNNSCTQWTRCRATSWVMDQAIIRAMIWWVVSLTWCSEECRTWWWGCLECRYHNSNLSMGEWCMVAHLSQSLLIRTMARTPWWCLLQWFRLQFVWPFPCLEKLASLPTRVRLLTFSKTTILLQMWDRTWKEPSNSFRILRLAPPMKESAC